MTALVLEPAGVDIEQVMEWVLLSGAAGAVIVAAWLLEAKQRVIENMAPVLTRRSRRCFAVMLAVAAVAYALTGRRRLRPRAARGVRRPHGAGPRARAVRDVGLGPLGAAGPDGPHPNWSRSVARCSST